MDRRIATAMNVSAGLAPIERARSRFELRLRAMDDDRAGRPPLREIVRAPGGGIFDGPLPASGAAPRPLSPSSQHLLEVFDRAALRAIGDRWGYPPPEPPPPSLWYPL